ncbi:MAG: WG repeat-containing protein [Flammeovirgaceae bacterium]
MKQLVFLLILLISNLTDSIAQSIFEQQGKYGLKQEDGSVMLKAEYFQILPIQGGQFLLCKENPNYQGVAGVQKHETPSEGINSAALDLPCQQKTAATFSFNANLHYGLVVSSTNIIPANYQAIHFLADQDRYVIKQGDYYYLYNLQKKKPAKKPKLSSICSFGNGFIGGIAGKYGILNKAFKFKHKPIYDQISPLNDDIYGLEQGGDKYVMSRFNLELITAKTVQEIYLDSIGGNALFKQNGKYGIMEIYEGNVLIPAQYDAIRTFELKGMIRVQQNGLWGILDVEGEYEYLAFQYQAIQVLDQKSATIRVKVAEGWKVMTLKEKFELVSNQAYEKIEAYQDWAYLIQVDGKQGFVKKEGFEEILTPQFDQIKLNTSNSFIEVGTGTKKGLLSKNDLSVILPAEYTDYQDISLKDQPTFLLKKNNRWGMQELTGQKRSIPHEYDKLEAYGNNEWFIAWKGRSQGLLSLKTDTNPALGFKYTAMRIDVKKDGCLVYAQKNGAWGILEVFNNGEVKTIRDFTLEEIAPIEGEGLDGYVKIKKNGLFGLYQLNDDLFSQSMREVLPPEFEDISYESKLTVRVRKQGQAGSATLTSGNVLLQNSMEDLFPIKWKVEIGQSTFRTNMMLANGVLLVGSNGNSRGSLADAKDGLYLIDPKTGRITQHIRPDLVGDTDVNGVAVSGDRFYFGNDAHHVFCYDFSGKQIWGADVDGDIEGSPTLFDVNKDGLDDAIFATEGGSVVAFNGANGIKLWEYKAANGGYFTATPAAYDITGDAIPDVMIGTGGSPYFYAINGKTGKALWQFKTKSTSGFVNGSGIHASANVLLERGKAAQIIATESYGIIHYLNKSGQWKRYIGNTIGIFSTPVFSPKGTIVNGAAWLGRGNVDVTVIRSYSDWEEQRGGVRYAARRTQMDGSPVAVTSSSAFVADVLAKGYPQFGIADETGKFQLINEDGLVEEIMLAPAGVEAPMLVQDIDGDGMLEIVVACLDGKLYCFDTKSTAKAFWGQFRGDNKNTGVIRK